MVELQHRAAVKRAKFDGIFTYFASNGFSHGSSWKNWRSLGAFCAKNSLLFCPSVGPGYVDTRVRPWNGASTRDRRRGAYYDMAWRTAAAAAPDIVSVTSFNEWHEGTQIEEAVPKSSKDGSFTYLDYLPGEQDLYLRRTAEWVEAFERERDTRTKK